MPGLGSGVASVLLLVLVLFAFWRRRRGSLNNASTLNLPHATLRNRGWSFDATRILLAHFPPRDDLEPGFTGGGLITVALRFDELSRPPLFFFAAFLAFFFAVISSGCPDYWPVVVFERAEG